MLCCDGEVNDDFWFNCSEVHELIGDEDFAGAVCNGYVGVVQRRILIVFADYYISDERPYRDFSYQLIS